MEDFRQVLANIVSVNVKAPEAADMLTEIVSSRLRRLSVMMIEMPIGEGLVRARRLETDEKFHYKIMDYSYNPEPWSIKIGRANLPGQQVLYTSRNRVTALGEVRFIYTNREKRFSRYSFGRWDVSDRLQLAAIVDPDAIYERESGELFGLADFINETLKGVRNDPTLAGVEEVYKYMAGKFTEPIKEGEEDRYKVTAVFSNFVY